MTRTAYTYDQPNHPNPFAPLINHTRQRTTFCLIAEVELETIFSDKRLTWAQRGILIDIIRRCHVNDNQSVKVHVKHMVEEAGGSADALYDNLTKLEALGYITRRTRRLDHSTELHYCVPEDKEMLFHQAESRKGREHCVATVPITSNFTPAPTPPAAPKKTKKSVTAVATPTEGAEVLVSTAPTSVTTHHHPYEFTEAEYAYTATESSDISHWPQRSDLPTLEVQGPFLDLTQHPLSLPKLLVNPPIPHYLPHTLDALIDIQEHDCFDQNKIVRKATLPLRTILGRVYALLYRTAAFGWYMEDNQASSSSLDLLNDYTPEEQTELELSSNWYFAQLDVANTANAEHTTPVAYTVTPSGDEAVERETLQNPLPQRHSKNYVQPLPAGSLPTGDALTVRVRCELTDMMEDGSMHPNCRQKRFSTLVEEVLYYLSQPYKADSSGQIKADAREARW
ncbi:MAG: hypothetical protein V4490_02780, partial [Pseudomonadota bacterium]